MMSMPNCVNFSHNAIRRGLCDAKAASASDISDGMWAYGWYTMRARHTEVDEKGSPEHGLKHAKLYLVTRFNRFSRINYIVEEWLRDASACTRQIGRYKRSRFLYFTAVPAPGRSLDNACRDLHGLRSDTMSPVSVHRPAIPLVRGTIA